MYKKEKYNEKVTCSVNLPYLCYIPEEYDGSKPFPLVVYLHGAGESGDDVERIANIGFFSKIKAGEKFPVLMVGPLCSRNKYWGNYLERLNIFLDHIVAEYNVDTSRIYLTGPSMGGTGTWLWLLANPERFAAAAPVCGTGVCWAGERIKDKPIWVIHGDEDEGVPLRESIAMVDGIKLYGGNPRVTILKGVGHNAWDYTFDQELIDWFLQYKLNE